MTDDDGSQLLTRLTALRQHQRAGVRSPHKPLLVLLALGRLIDTGSSAMPWSWAEQRLAALLTDFGPPSRTVPAQSAAYPFTHLRSDLVWVLDHDVPMDRVGPLREYDVVGSLAPELEDRLRADPAALYAVAGQLVEAEFPAVCSPTSSSPRAWNRSVFSEASWAARPPGVGALDGRN